VTTPISHSAIAHEGLAAGFVAGTLGTAERERFEDHLIECPQCQAEVALGLRIRAVGEPSLRAAPLAVPQPGTRRWMLPLVGVAAAAVIIAVLPPRGDRAALTALGGVPVAPVYLGVSVRAASDAAESTFDASFDDAMAAYQRAEWRVAFDALSALSQRSDAREASVMVHFFAGAAALMLDDAARADAEFATLLALADSPYHAEARYYRAKALLRLGRGREATRELRAVRDAELAPRAAALADSIEGLGTR
jgi:hypothetical protein